MDSMYLFLIQYWWLLISVLGGLLVFLLFVQGGQSMLYSLARDETERSMLVNALGRKWGLTYTTLVTFGGAFFASFPLFYSTSFGGAIWVWTAILLCFVLQAVAYEFRSKPRNVLGRRTFDIFLYINGVLGTILLGTAVGTFFTGSDFFVSKGNLTDLSQPIISYWGNPWHGLEAVLDVRNVMLGVAICFLARILGMLYFINLIDNERIYTRAKRLILYNTIPFLIFFLGFVISILLSKGFAVHPETGEVFLEPYKYWNNFIQMPVVLLIFLVGVVGVLWGIISTLFMGSRKGIWFAGAGTFLTVVGLFLNIGYNNTAYYPSFDLQSSLTIYNSCSSKFTLGTMSIVSILIPFVVAYIWYSWRKMDKTKLTRQEIETAEQSGEDIY